MDAVWLIVYLIFLSHFSCLAFYLNIGCSRTFHGLLHIERFKCSTEQWSQIKTFRLRQNCRYFPDGISTLLFVNEDASISITISLKFVPMVQINHILSLV